MVNRTVDQIRDAARLGIKVLGGVNVRIGPMTPAANQATAKFPQNSAKTFR